jgi:energy-coupling factor transport system substrate-specific component
MFSAWALLAVEASGSSPAARRVERAGLRYLAGTVRQARDPGAVERTIMAVAGAGQNPRSFAGTDLVARLQRMIARNGSIDGLTNLTTFGALALHAARVTVPARMLAWLVRQQDADGGFNYATAGGPSDVDDTGAVLAVLGEPAARRRYARALARAIAYLRSQQNRDGGFGMGDGAPSNAQSTAFAVCGLIGADAAPASLHRHGAVSPLAYLRSLTGRDGAIDYSRGEAQTPVWVTAEAQIALAGRAF